MSQSNMDTSLVLTSLATPQTLLLLVSPVMYISFSSLIESIHNHTVLHHVVLGKGYHMGWAAW